MEYFSHERKSGHQEGRGFLPKEKMKFRVNCFLQFDGRVGRKQLGKFTGERSRQML